MSLSYILSVLSLISLVNINQAMFPSFGSDFINSEDTLFCDECRCMKLSAEMAYFQDANVCLECFAKVLNESGENSVPSSQHHSPQPNYQQNSRSASPEFCSVAQPESQSNANSAQQFATNDPVETQQQIYCSVNRKALVLLAVVAAAGVYYTGKKIYNKLRKRPILASPVINTSDLTSSNEE